MITVRPPIALDTADMARLLNERADIATLMAEEPDKSAWHVALDTTERVVGFQWITCSDDLPPQAADISTFVQVGRTGLGIASSLFDATKRAAKELGYSWINANIRADNEGGLIYYQSRGFVDYGVIEGYKLADGQIVDKRLKRFDLK